MIQKEGSKACWSVCMRRIQRTRSLLTEVGRVSFIPAAVQNVREAFSLKYGTTVKAHCTCSRTCPRVMVAANYD